MRELTSAMQTELQVASVAPRLLAYFDFPSGAVRVWNGVGDLSWDGHTWKGVGHFGSFKPPGGGTDISAKSAVFQLNGIESSQVSLALGDDYQNRVCRAYFAFIDENGEVIDNPYKWEGRMDTIEIQEEGNTSAISIRAESRLIDLDRPRERRYSHEDQQDLYPGDKGLEFAASVPDMEIHWGVPNQQRGVGGPPPYITDEEWYL